MLGTGKTNRPFFQCSGAWVNMFKCVPRGVSWSLEWTSSKSPYILFSNCSNFFLCLLQIACYWHCFKVRVDQKNHLRMSPSLPTNQFRVYPVPRALPLSHLYLLCIPVSLTEPGLQKRNWGQDLVRRILLLLPPLQHEPERAQLDFHMSEVEFAESWANLLWKCQSPSRGELWFNLVK